jgi:tetratricopeptide (TPR) repeat protein
VTVVVDVLQPALHDAKFKPSSTLQAMSTPTPAQFQYEIGARMARADWDGAGELAAACRAAWTADASGWILGSMAALFADKKEAALLLADEWLAKEPRNLQCLLQRAECLFALGSRDSAIASAEAAATVAGENAQALDAIAVFLAYAGDFARALPIYDRAVAAAGSDASLLAKRAAVHEYLGDFALATRDYERALTLSPTNAEALKGLAELSRQTPQSNRIVAMQAALAATRPDSKDAAAIHFGLAKSYDDLAEYEPSWRHLVAGNDIERSHLRYDRQQDLATVDGIIAAFPNPERAAPDTTGEAPIFIVGMPRSGTTLVERIIGNHSRVHSAGESSALSDAINAAVDQVARQNSSNWLQHIQMFGRLDGEMVARGYLARVRARRGDRARFSDKTPTNFFHCALILRAFPNARIVHMTRHPLAACYAVYKTRFNGAFPFCYDLLELADFYIGYRRLMSHWERILPGRILNLAYEEIVTDHEASARRLLDFVDLPFEAACLNFHLNPASTSTASSVQVRQPLYDSSLEHWKHYASELAPLRDRLLAAGISPDDAPGSVTRAAG